MVALGMVAVGYALALVHGQLDVASLPAFGLLVLAAVLLRCAQVRILTIAGHAIFIAMALALGLHLLPGFGNALVIDRAVLSPGAAPYSMYLNLDKPLIALWLLCACPWIAPPVSPAAAGRAALLAAPAAIVVCLGLGVSFGLIAWAPHWPAWTWIWIANNLLLVCLAEEALFRGYVQGGLARFGPAAARVALPASALLFGAAHAGGGIEWVLLAVLAGLGYGWAYRRGGLLAAIATHFLVNLAHFLLFTYPSLAS